MKRILVAATAAVGLFGGLSGALAADMVDHCADTWGGFYVGAHGGYQTGDTDTIGILGDADIDGLVGGGLAGYNVQFCQFVVGVEGDFGFGEVDGGDQDVREASLDAQGHGRVRLGYPIDSIMPFVAGGVALGDIEVRRTLAAGGGEDSRLHAGFSVGGGLDVMVSDNVVLRAEYLYDNYESLDYAIGGGARVDADPHTVRGAVIWKF
jgi:outer membrane immunogenic protein